MFVIKSKRLVGGDTVYYCTDTGAFIPETLDVRIQPTIFAIIDEAVVLAEHLASKNIPCSVVTYGP